jgi:putative tryptophan/tyrosine transport system substrate-binding protein
MRVATSSSTRRLGGAVAWPFAARAQQPGRMRRIGVLMGLDENDPDAKVSLSDFTQGLSELGWTDGRNVRIDVRWAGDNVDRMRMFAKELVNLQPDVILSQNTAPTAALHRETRTIPIVFVTVADPVGAGFVASLPRPGGNVTGLISQEAAMGGKWLELLTQIAPGVKRAAAMFNPDTAPAVESYYLPLFEAAARSLKAVPIAAPVHRDAEIENGHDLAWARSEGRPCRHAGSFHFRSPRANYIAGSPKQCAGGVSGLGLCQRRRFAFLRTRPQK